MSEAAARLAEARGESLDAVYRRFSVEEIEKAPARFNKHIPALRQAELMASGVDDGLAWVRLDTGRIFYSPLTHAALRRQYPYVADIIPDCITADTLLAAIDVVQRYLTDFTWPPAEILPSGDTANIIEVGAYLGHKTIRFADELAGTKGRILAIEMMPENCEILRRNIAANGYSDRIEVLPVGVWKEDGSITGYTKGRQRNSIVAIDKLENGERFEAQTQTLNQIVDDWKVSPVDLVFVTINGVEVEALEGFTPDGRDVRSFFVAAPYLDKDRNTNAERCRELLSKYGYQLIDIGNPNRVVAKWRSS